MKFSRQEFIQPNSHESADLTKIARIFCTSRIQGPIPAPSQMNNLQLIKFQPTPAITRSQSVIHDTSLNFDPFVNRKAGTQCQNRGINIASLKFEPLLIYTIFYTYVSNILIQCRQTHEFRVSQLCPTYLDHPSCKIPRCNSANILKPVLTSFISLKIDEKA